MKSSNKIKILPQVEALKIAAGEVVERPCSVVKELIENSIDAKATQISLFIEKAGKKLIRVLDNGCGMSLADAKLCVYPHATSKINCLEDLVQISTFGFRGEALAAISAVSKFQIITKTHDAIVGSKLCFDQGLLVEESEVSASKGTDLIIEDLFFNTPVRKKFLKQDETEWNQIESLFDAFCLSYKDINFKLYKDGKLIVNAPATLTIKDRICQLRDNNFAENFIIIDQERDGVRIEGLISNHQTWYYNKNNIYLFVNNRFVKNMGLSRALLKGYLNVLPQDKFPAACLFISLDSKDVDVNVHPRKEEVKFSKPHFIETILQECVKKTLENYISSKLKVFVPEASSNALSNVVALAKFESNEINNSTVFGGVIENFDFEVSPFTKTNSVLSTSKIPSVENNIIRFNILPNDASLQKTMAYKYESEVYLEPLIKNEVIKETRKNERIIGQLLNTYILIENEDGLTIIDQHAAHERILYERFKENFFKQEGTALLFPEIISLAEHHKNILLLHSGMLLDFGLDIEDFGFGVLAIKSSPPLLKNSSISSILLEIASILEECENLSNEKGRMLFFEKAHAMMACKAAIKAGDVLNIEQMKQLVNDLYSCENRLICVHGRPTIWSMSKNQLEKTFQRKL